MLEPRTCRVKPGDVVIIERHTRTKGDTRFDTKRHTVLEKRNSSLVLSDEAGRVIKRQVTQTKKRSNRGVNLREIWKARMTTRGDHYAQKKGPSYLTDYVMPLSD